MGLPRVTSLVSAWLGQRVRLGRALAPRLNELALLVGCQAGRRPAPQLLVMKLGLLGEARLPILVHQLLFDCRRGLLLLVLVVRSALRWALGDVLNLLLILRWLVLPGLGAVDLAVFLEVGGAAAAISWLLLHVALRRVIGARFFRQALPLRLL